jgi:murein L,D-transpeptidase YcbB/YkuD
VWWHLHRLFRPEGAAARPVFEAAARIDQAFAFLPSLDERVRAFQSEQSLTVDGWLGRETTRVANEKLPAVLVER